MDWREWRAAAAEGLADSFLVLVFIQLLLLEYAAGVVFLGAVGWLNYELHAKVSSWQLHGVAAGYGFAATLVFGLASLAGIVLVLGMALSLLTGIAVDQTLAAMERLRARRQLRHVQAERRAEELQLLRTVAPPPVEEPNNG